MARKKRERSGKTVSVHFKPENLPLLERAEKEAKARGLSRAELFVSLLQEKYPEPAKIPVCPWFMQTLTRKGKITAKQVKTHQKSCSVCQAANKRVLKDVKHSIPLDDGWKEPKCPFCFEDIEAPKDANKTENCSGCGATYALDPFCDSGEDILSVVAWLVEKEEYEICTHDLAQYCDIHVYHNYDPAKHCFNEFLSGVADISVNNFNLCHLYFVRRKRKKPLAEFTVIIPEKEKKPIAKVKLTVPEKKKPIGFTVPKKKD